jgi:tRNA nucleotidyltransferase (CCA-adding enzyme)
VTGEQLLQALAAQPGGPQLLELGQTGEELALVGGAVRDLLLGRAPRELDVVLAGDLPALAATLAALLGASVTAHERFGTAIVAWQQGRIDLAARRAESYSAPGALPDVRPGSLEQDLRRRDFTVNAIALPLGGPHRGQLQAAEHALEDLRERRLRVLHDHSFRDDPTRLLRLARYRARLRFGVEPHTAELAAQALAAGALASVSPARIGAELRLALQEADAVAALQALGELGVLAALASSRQGQPLLRFDAQLARQALALLPDDGRPELLLMATLLLDLAADTSSDPQPVMFELLDSLEFSAGERQRIIRSALGASALSRELERAHKPSQLHQALSAQTLEAVALTGGLIAARQRHVPAQLSDWLARLRHVQLQINGEDLLAAGIRSGPELGMRLNAALARKLDGELAEGREAELQAALEAEVQRR